VAIFLKAAREFQGTALIWVCCGRVNVIGVFCQRIAFSCISNCSIYRPRYDPMLYKPSKAL
jgi:hypothetical protein